MRLNDVKAASMGEFCGSSQLLIGTTVNMDLISELVRDELVIISIHFSVLTINLSSGKILILSRFCARVNLTVYVCRYSSGLFRERFNIFGGNSLQNE